MRSFSFFSCARVACVQHVYTDLPFHICDIGDRGKLMGPLGTTEVIQASFAMASVEWSGRRIGMFQGPKCGWKMGPS